MRSVSWRTSWTGASWRRSSSRGSAGHARTMRTRRLTEATWRKTQLELGEAQRKAAAQKVRDTRQVGDRWKALEWAYNMPIIAYLYLFIALKNL